MSDDVFKLLEDLEGYIQGCRHVPMTDKVLVGEETLLDYIDRIRSLLPEELRQARLMVKDREHLMDDARVEVERIFAEANQRIEGMIRESEVVKRAEAAAEEIVAQSRRVAHEIRNNATLYADDVMSNLETSLEQNLDMIRSGREELSQMKRDRQRDQRMMMIFFSRAHHLLRVYPVNSAKTIPAGTHNPDTRGNQDATGPVASATTRSGCPMGAVR